MIRLGLCCVFRDQPIKFGHITAFNLRKLPRPQQLTRLAALCAANADALMAALACCVKFRIGCFRINSQILPLKTHPELGYAITDLPDGNAIVRMFQECGAFARQHNLRTTFHPDQFVVLNSPRPEVVAASIRELEYQAEVAEWVNADVINIHAGGVFGDKTAALKQLAVVLGHLPPAVRRRLTLENDDKCYTPADLVPLCRSENVPLCYDVHHHRCLPDGQTIAAATEQALGTWPREPLFHISSPQDGWRGPRPERHHDFINVRDFPTCWRGLNITVEVEARAKELAVVKLQQALARRKPPASA